MAGGASEGEGGLTAPMPGKVIALHVEVGQQVSQGTPLLVMEAMKMEHTIVAPRDGMIAGLAFAVGDQVGEGDTLVELGEPAGRAGAQPAGADG